ncbi:MAG: hypothetical protein F6K42_14215 [Leptolyngbya sp. SIO1D8]|nr:hypothetical protein [Leptolyngbya sp. SIO1D8]
MFSPEDHPLKGWIPPEGTFEVDFKSTAETLTEQLNVSQGKLDGTLASLDVISSSINRLKNSDMNLDFFLLLLSYFGEVIRRSIDGSWELKQNQDADVCEPWIKYSHPTGATYSMPPHFALNQELKKAESCSLRVAAEQVIENLNKAFLPRPRIGGLKNHYSDGDLVILRPDALIQTELLITPEVHTVVEKWLIESINYFSKFEFFNNHEDASVTSLTEVIAEIKKAFEDRFISNQSIDEFFLKFVDVKIGTMNPIKEPASKTKFLAAYLLRLDRNRVWSDREIPEVIPKGDLYFEILNGLSRVSRGFLTITKTQNKRSNIEEHSFDIKVEDSRHILVIGECDKPLLFILDSINQLLDSEDFSCQFYLYSEMLPEEKIVIMFSEDEKLHLRRDKMFYV